MMGVEHAEHPSFQTACDHLRDAQRLAANGDDADGKASYDSTVRWIEIAYEDAALDQRAALTSFRAHVEATPTDLASDEAQQQMALALQTCVS